MSPSEPIDLRVNGQERRFSGRSLDDLLRDEGIAEPTGIAVAVNGRVIPRADWARHRPNAGDEIEIVNAVQGG